MRISLEQALNILMDHVTHGKTERKTLEDCLGLVLSEDVYALLDMPPFSRSAQDGYALCSKDSIGATGENPVKLKVTGKIYAGDHLDVQVRPGEAVLKEKSIKKAIHCFTQVQRSMQQLWLLPVETALWNCLFIGG